PSPAECRESGGQNGRDLPGAGGGDLMADWRLLAQKLALAEGRIGTEEARVIREELLADGKIDKSEFEFLIALRRGAQSVDPAFDDLVFRVIKPILLKDGHISPEQTAWLKRLFMADGLIDARE